MKQYLACKLITVASCSCLLLNSFYYTHTDCRLSDRRDCIPQTQVQVGCQWRPPRTSPWEIPSSRM